MTDKKVPGRPFEKGQSGNPAGRPVTPPDLRGIQKLNKDTLDRLLNKLLWMTKEQLLAHLKAADTPAYEVLVGNVLLKGISGGDEKRAEWLASRTAGKVKEEIEVSGLKPYVAVLSDGKQIVMGVKDDGGDNTT
jgi:hypothetical protein